MTSIPLASAPPGVRVREVRPHEIAFFARLYNRSYFDGDATEHGCSLVVSRCSVGSPSQRNMERAGLRTAYTKVVWVRELSTD